MEYGLKATHLLQHRDLTLQLTVCVDIICIVMYTQDLELKLLNMLHVFQCLSNILFSVHFPCRKVFTLFMCLGWAAGM